MYRGYDTGNSTEGLHTNYNPYGWSCYNSGWDPWYASFYDPFDYFNDELRSTLVAKSLRSTQPLGGKFDYDIDGRLIGNWFEEGTNGYAGISTDSYWEGHMAIAYNHLDPSHIIISLGSFNGRANQYGVMGNSPDPADVGVDSGSARPGAGRAAEDPLPVLRSGCRELPGCGSEPDLPRRGSR